MGWKFDQNNPIYLQIITHLEYMILAGQYRPGDKLESVRDLAAIAGVNPNTMQKALQEMEGIGLIHTHRTSGRFITEDHEVIQKLRHEIAGEKAEVFVSELKRLGYTNEEILNIVSERIRPSKAISNLEDFIKEEEHGN